MIKEFHIQTPGQDAFIDITDRVEKIIGASSVKSGVCAVFVPHTTAGVTINENADPSVRRDIIKTLEKAIPNNAYYEHSEGNSPAHIKASLMGSSAIVFIQNGSLSLGAWQGIYFCEFDGPRRRKVMIKVISDK